jgi:hypothetical protein
VVVLKDSEVLVCEISGKRPGTSKERPTEKFECRFDKVIISNDCDGYETDWEIVKVPDEYKDWYLDNFRVSENAWYAPMNRSYAIKYAKEQGYKYCIQLDDNITLLQIKYKLDLDGISKKYYSGVGARSCSFFNNFVEVLCAVLENTNACLAGCGLSANPPGDRFMREGYCYSLFALDLATCPEVFHGGFEDDIEYRYKCHEKKLPTVMVQPLQYGKTGQRSSGDKTGCRAEYERIGLGRGEVMRKIHGDMYRCGKQYKSNCTSNSRKLDTPQFGKKIKSFKDGIIVRDIEPIYEAMRKALKECANDFEENVEINEV